MGPRRADMKTESGGSVGVPKRGSVMTLHSSVTTSSSSVMTLPSSEMTLPSG